MLPSNLLVARTRGGTIRPVYASVSPRNLEVAVTLIRAFQRHIGGKRGELTAEVRQYEEAGFDYRFVRGLSTLLERRCRFEAEASVDPLTARRTVYEATGKGLVATGEDRAEVLGSVAGGLGVSIEDLEQSMYADLEDELILRDFRPVNPEALLKQYNLSLTQTLLFRSTRIEVRAKGQWKNILRQVKYLGLIYSAEVDRGQFHVTVDGPLSIFRLTRRYGTSVAKLLPTILEAENWEVRADVVRGGAFGKRLLRLRLSSGEAGRIMRPWWPVAMERAFDSGVEERFSRKFEALESGWKLTREPEPLVVGKHVMIPDFSFERDGEKVYLEVVGFWTKEYLERKIRKLQELQGVEMLVAVDRDLACSKLRRIKGNILYYHRDVPLKPILNYLQEKRERSILKQAEALDLTRVKLAGDVVELKEIAEKLGVSQEAVRRKIGDVKAEGYRLIGDAFLSEAKIQKIEAKIASIPDMTVSAVTQAITGEGVKSPYQVLDALGYAVQWRGLDPEKSTVHKREV